jgi:hypothetical protein
MSRENSDDDPAVGMRGMRARYDDVSSRTIDRWAASGKLPKPDFYIGPHKYWRRSTLERHERLSVVKSRPAKAQSTSNEDFGPSDAA